MLLLSFHTLIGFISLSSISRSRFLQMLDIFCSCISYFRADADLHVLVSLGRCLDFDKRAPLWHHQTLGPGSERSLPGQHLLQSAGGGHWHRTLEHDPQPRGAAGCQGLGVHTHKHTSTHKDPTHTQQSPDVKINSTNTLGLYPPKPI